MARPTALFAVVPAFVALFLAGAGIAPAVVIRDDRPDSAYRDLGEAPQFAGVGRVEIRFAGDPADLFYASGAATYIGGNRLVTAAHVFDSVALDDVAEVRVNFNDILVAVDFAQIHLHPLYQRSNFLNDIAVVGMVAEPTGIAPAAFYGGPQVALGTAVTIVGYGNTGTGLTGSTVGSIDKRAAQNALDFYDTVGTFAFEVDFDMPGNPSLNVFGSPVPLDLEGLIGPGDSGGSVWMQVGSTWVIVGINSYGIDMNDPLIFDGYGDVSGFTYVPAYLAFVEGFGEILVVVPEPGVLALLALAAFALPFLPRRRRAGADRD